jgi:sulfur-oxidizing protein SoxZ
MPDPMKIRANVVGDSTEVRVLMSHEMETGQRRDAQGKVIPAWFIQNVVVAHNGKPVLNAQWGPRDREEPFPLVQVQGRRQGRQDRDHLGRQPRREAHRRNGHRLIARCDNEAPSHVPRSRRSATPR